MKPIVAFSLAIVSSLTFALPREGLHCKFDDGIKRNNIFSARVGEDYTRFKEFCSLDLKRASQASPGNLCFTSNPDLEKIFEEIGHDVLAMDIYGVIHNPPLEFVASSSWVDRNTFEIVIQSNGTQGELFPVTRTERIKRCRRDFDYGY